MIAVASPDSRNSAPRSLSADPSSAPIPQFDLSLQHQTLGPELEAAMSAVVRSGRCILGPEVEAFEREFAAYLGVEHVVSVGSGTDALVLALKARGFPAGGEVVTSPFTFAATASSIVHAGLRPVFADIDPDTLCLHPQAVQAGLTDRTVGVLPVHLFGAVADMPAFRTLAETRALFLLEDAAQACGSRLGGRAAGTWGDAGCFSFYPTKNLGAAGDAGAVATSDPALAERIRLLRGHGAARRFEHLEVGGTHRLDALQAAVLRVKLPRLSTWLADRERIADIYLDALAGTDFVLPARAPGRTWNLFSLQHPDRDAVVEHLRARGVGTEIYYPRPLHLQPCFASLGYGPGAFPVAESVAARIFSLPLWPELSQTRVARVVEALVSFGRRVPRRPR